ncbi:MAG TPA: Holliday junction branch migration protein RuvA [Candidatus Polarisedimenticolia bacterium]|nr:Holliday junction branch migration protein RuvA [Candidatus Polarisedimenticolia bacterium]
MIARLTGRLVEREPHQVVVEVAGVGYRISTPLSTFCALPAEGTEVTLRIHTHVREDAIALFGFATRLEQELFERLIDVNGIGPRVALAILSGLPAEGLIAAIAEADSAALRRIPGVGPKTADRIVLELRDRLPRAAAHAGGGEPAGAANGSLKRDVVSALVNLGYQTGRAEEAVRRAAASSEGSREAPGLQEILKRSLKYLA